MKRVNRLSIIYCTTGRCPIIIMISIVPHHLSSEKRTVAAISSRYCTTCRCPNTNIVPCLLTSEERAVVSLRKYNTTSVSLHFRVPQLPSKQIPRTDCPTPWPQPVHSRASNAHVDPSTVPLPLCPRQESDSPRGQCGIVCLEDLDEVVGVLVVPEDWEVKDECCRTLASLRHKVLESPNCPHYYRRAISHCELNPSIYETAVSYQDRLRRPPASLARPSLAMMNERWTCVKSALVQAPPSFLLIRILVGLLHYCRGGGRASSPESFWALQEPDISTDL